MHIVHTVYCRFIYLLNVYHRKQTSLSYTNYTCRKERLNKMQLAGRLDWQQIQQDMLRTFRR